MTYLLLRLSSLGNVAMTVPVIASLSERYPEHRFIVVAKKPLAAMFYGMKNVTYHEARFTGGISSIIRLYRELKIYKIDAVIDLQDVLRTRILRTLYKMSGAHTYCIQYGRTQKRALTIRGHRSADRLKTEFERYEETFAAAGLQTDEQFTSIPIKRQAREAVIQRFGEKKGNWIGIAPFAKSKSNMLPFRITKELIQHYSALPDTRVYLFGAGEIESEMLRQWASIFPNVISVAGLLPLEQELELMRMLEVMICMDSANQHLSSLVSLRAVSIWCATHPKMGFRGWKQDPTDIIENIDLNCRPCTIHGTNHCRYRNFACREITAEKIIKKVQEKKYNTTKI